MISQVKAEQSYKKIVLLFMFVGAWISGNAQVKEINPSVQWNYVYQEPMEAVNGQLYTFEFPMEKGYDYGISLVHRGEGANASIKIFDLQMKPVAEYESDQLNNDRVFTFDVSHHTTYLIYFLVNSKSDQAKLPIEFTIIRRLKT